MSHSTVIRMGAAHNSITVQGSTYDMATDFGDTPRSSQRAARLAVVDSFTEAFGSRKDKRRLRRIRKGLQA